jgi:hypothetical protein
LEIAQFAFLRLAARIDISEEHIKLLPGALTSFDTTRIDLAMYMRF